MPCQQPCNVRNHCWQFHESVTTSSSTMISKRSVPHRTYPPDRPSSIYSLAMQWRSPAPSSLSAGLCDQGEVKELTKQRAESQASLTKLNKELEQEKSRAEALTKDLTGERKTVAGLQTDVAGLNKDLKERQVWLTRCGDANGHDRLACGRVCGRSWRGRQTGGVSARLQVGKGAEASPG